MRKIVDYDNIIYKIFCEMKEVEQLYFITADEKEDKIIFNEYFEIEKYIVNSTSDRVEMNKTYLYAALKTIAAQNKVCIILHTHPKQISGNLKASYYDELFFESVSSFWVEFGNEKPIVFGILGQENVIFKVYKNGMITDGELVTKYDNFDADAWDLKALVGNDLDYGVVCHRKTGTLAKVSTEKLLLLKKWIAEYEKGELSQISNLAYKKFIADNFDFSQKLRVASESSYRKTGEINNLQFMIQLGCNLRCKYCYAHDGTYDYGKNWIIDVETGKRIVDSLIKKGIHTIHKVTFFGGEPSLFPDTINAICKYVEKLQENKLLNNDIQFFMVTNCTYMPDDLIKTIKKYNIRLTISLDGNPIVNDQLRVHANGSGTYENVITNIKRMRDAEVEPVMIEATYTCIHEKEKVSRAEVKKELERLTGIKSVLLVDCEGEYAPKTEEVIQNDNETEDILELYTLGKICMQMETKGSINDVYCSAGHHDMAILANGEVYPCHRFVSDKATCLGNVFIDDTEIGTLDVCNKQNNDKCKKCWAINYCKRCNWRVQNQQESYECEQYLSELEEKILKIINLSNDEKLEFKEQIANATYK